MTSYFSEAFISKDALNAQDTGISIQVSAPSGGVAVTETVPYGFLFCVYVILSYKYLNIAEIKANLREYACYTSDLSHVQKVTEKAALNSASTYENPVVPGGTEPPNSTVDNPTNSSPTETPIKRSATPKRQQTTRAKSSPRWR